MNEQEQINNLEKRLSIAIEALKSISRIVQSNDPHLYKVANIESVVDLATFEIEQIENRFFKEKLF